MTPYIFSRLYSQIFYPEKRNINLFFSKQKVKVPSVRELFEFIVETNITEENLGKNLRNFSLKIFNIVLDEYIDTMMTKALDRSEAETEFENEQDKIFIEMPIPRTLSEIGFLQAEKDIREGKQGTGSTLYGIVTGMKSDMSGTGKNR